MISSQNKGDRFWDLIWSDRYKYVKIKITAIITDNADNSEPSYSYSRY
ncbi:hypothetical protein [Nostoc sp. PCC 7107]|nr:hypothetical protein [Nostoc sp. PCC 7107]